MNHPAFWVDVRAESFTVGNEAARQLSAGWPEAAQGWPLELLRAEATAAALDGQPCWLRLPSGQRLWTGALMLPLPDDAGRALLSLRSASEAELDARVAPALAAILVDYQQGAAPTRVLGAICEALQQSLGLALVRALQIDGGALLECAACGDAAAAAAARQLPRRLDAGSAAAQALAAGATRIVKLDAAGNDAAQRTLQHAGVQAMLACLLQGFDQTFALELFAYGAEDFAEARTQAFLDRWIVWLNRGLNLRRLQQQDQLLAEALRCASTAAFITDTRGTIVWINPAFTTRYGYAASEVIGQTPRLLQSGKHGALYYERLWAALTAGRAWSGDTVDRTADGRVVIVRQSVTPVRRDGRVTHFLSIHTDQTAEAQFASIADLQRRTDVITGVMTQAAFEEHCREQLISASAEQQTPSLLLMSVQTRSGATPELSAEAAAFARSVIGERIRSVIGDRIASATLSGFDFAFLLPHPGQSQRQLERELGELLSAPLPLLGETLELSCRFGAAHYPADGADFDALRRSAERQLLQQTGPARAVTVPATAASPALPPPR